MVTTTATKTPRIYVACLASYNSGRLHGEWINATLDPEDLQIEIDQMLAHSPERIAEDWAIHDSEGFGGVLGENEDLETVSRLGQGIEEHGKAFIALCKHVGAEYATPQLFEQLYRGEHDSEEDFAEEHFYAIHQIPGYLQDYIDWEAVARDLFTGEFYSVQSDDGVYVFDRY